MNRFRLIAASLLATVSLLSPALALACGLDTASSGDGGIMQTPLRMRGQYIFIQRLSRRQLLKQAISRQQVQQREQALVLPKEIL